MKNATLKNYLHSWNLLTIAGPETSTMPTTSITEGALAYAEAARGEFIVYSGKGEEIFNVTCALKSTLPFKNPSCEVHLCYLTPYLATGHRS